MEQAAAPTNESGAKAFGGLMAILAIGTFIVLVMSLGSNSVDMLGSATKMSLGQMRDDLDTAIATIADLREEISALDKELGLVGQDQDQADEDIDEIEASMKEDDAREKEDARKRGALVESQKEQEMQDRNLERFVRMLWLSEMGYELPAIEQKPLNGGQR